MEVLEKILVGDVPTYCNSCKNKSGHSSGVSPCGKCYSTITQTTPILKRTKPTKFEALGV